MSSRSPHQMQWEITISLAQQLWAQAQEINNRMGWAFTTRQNQAILDTSRRMAKLAYCLFPDGSVERQEIREWLQED